MTLLLPCWSPFLLLYDAFKLFIFRPTWQDERQAELHWYNYLMSCDTNRLCKWMDRVICKQHRTDCTLEKCGVFFGFFGKFDRSNVC